MSAGSFTDKVYVTNAGFVTSVRVQPETITAWNPNGAGSIIPGSPSAHVSGGRNKIGINCRKARFRWVGTPPVAPTGYLNNGIITLPMLTQSAYDALVKNVDYPYLGTGLNLVGKTDEKIR